MKNALVIGPSNSITVVYANDLLSQNNHLTGNIIRYYAGGSFSIAYNLQQLNVQTTLVSRTSYDDNSNEMYYQMVLAGGIMYPSTTRIKKLPEKIYVVDDNLNLQMIEDCPYDCYPSLTDGLPANIYDETDFGIITAVNNAYITKTIEKYPSLNWICNDCIPSAKDGNKIMMVTLSQQYLESIASSISFESIISNLLSSGIEYVITTNKANKATLYSKKDKQVFEMDHYGKYFISSHELFVAKLVSCLENGLDIHASIDESLSLVNDLSYMEENTLQPNLFNI